MKSVAIKKINLIYFGEGPCAEWRLGDSWHTKYSVLNTYSLLEKIFRQGKYVTWLFWDKALGRPNTDLVIHALKSNGKVLHCGLSLGMSGAPGMIDFVQPTWMLNRDPDKNIEATSWRISLRACLIPGEVIRQLGFIHKTFKSMDGASLELGHRYLAAGVILRNAPSLLEKEPALQRIEIPLEDELRYILYRFGKFWCGWAAARAVISRYSSLGKILKAWKKVRYEEKPHEPRPFERMRHVEKRKLIEPKVSIVIPTVGRYKYLRTLLEQISAQTRRPDEVVVIDQTPKEQREEITKSVAKDLVFKVFIAEEPGQCSSRNCGIRASHGDHLLFLDDDVEIPKDLVNKHLESLNRFGADVICGGVYEVGQVGSRGESLHSHLADTLPLGNALIKKEAFSRAGLLDLAYNKGTRADADLGMRIYLSGGLMVLCPEATVLHHRAGKGGLRNYGARKITVSGSKKSLFKIHLPNVTEIYLWHRYFSKRQIREITWLITFETFSFKGNKLLRGVKILIGILLLPHTIWSISFRTKKATLMKDKFPQIPRIQ